MSKGSFVENNLRAAAFSLTSALFHVARRIRGMDPEIPDSRVPNPGLPSVHPLFLR